MDKTFCKLAIFVSLCAEALAKISHDSIEMNHRTPRWAIMTPEYSAIGGNPIFWWSTWVKFFFGLYLAVMYAQFTHQSKQVSIYCYQLLITYSC